MQADELLLKRKPEDCSDSVKVTFSPAFQILYGVFLGSVTVYSHLQACGIINDHSPECYMYEKLTQMGNVRYIDL